MDVRRRSRDGRPLRELSSTDLNVMASCCLQRSKRRRKECSCSVPLESESTGEHLREETFPQKHLLHLHDENTPQEVLHLHHDETRRKDCSSTVPLESESPGEHLHLLHDENTTPQEHLHEKTSHQEHLPDGTTAMEVLRGLLHEENTPQDLLLHGTTTHQEHDRPTQQEHDGTTSQLELLHGTWCSPEDLLLLTTSSCSVKENQENFVLARRAPRRKEATSGVSMETLPDEILLRIFFCLRLPDLLRICAVCRRWNDLTRDESLWRSVDLGGASVDLGGGPTHTEASDWLVPGGGALQRVLTAGVRKLRCPASFISDLSITTPGFVDLRVRQMDLSNCTVSTSCLERILIGCSRLTHLSLESLLLSDRLMQALSQNTHMSQLNLCGCDGFSAASGGHMLRCFPRLKQLNMSWVRNFSRGHVRSVVNSLTSDLTHLNLSGYRETLTLEDVQILVKRCPKITTLDLSDSAQLTTDCFPVIGTLKDLLHLSLSRCYHIHPASLADMAELSRWFPSLRLLEVFGLIQSDQQEALMNNNNDHRIVVNSRPYSAVARPSAAGERESALTSWDALCRLCVD